jgi:hypothetical protein
MSRRRTRSLVVLFLAALLSLGGAVIASPQPETAQIAGRCCTMW